MAWLSGSLRLAGGPDACVLSRILSVDAPSSDEPVRPNLGHQHTAGDVGVGRGRAFWLLQAEDEVLAILSIIMLVVFATGYAGLVLLMMFLHKLVTENGAAQHAKTLVRWTSRRLSRSRVRVANADKSQVEPSALAPSSGLSWTKLKLPITKLRVFDSPALAIPKLVIQASGLITYLHVGFPGVITGSYSMLLFINWMIGTYRYWHMRDTDTRLVATRVAHSFDLFFAVFAPLQVLVYSYATFEFDHDAWQPCTLMPTTARLAYLQTQRTYL